MTDQDLWDLEESFWTAGHQLTGRVLDNECVMIFADPIGILTGAAIKDSLRGAVRWNSVTMKGRVLTRPTDMLAVLAYRATATREGSPSYRAYCSSTYRSGLGIWKLIQHQQTPIR